MSFRRYPDYKDSGVEWLGDVPATWKVNTLKRSGRLQGGAGFPPELQGVEGGELPFYKVADLGASIDGITMGSGQHTVTRDVAAQLGARIIPSSSIVYAKIGAALLLNKRRITNSCCCIDNNMTAYLPDPTKVRAKWAFYWMSILDFGKVANPGAVPSLSEGDQVILPIIVPPLLEQDVITQFLDYETKKTDALVAEQERLIGLLKEKRQAVISHAVTKGLNPNVPMKDSGMNWVGLIPSQWQVRKIRQLARLETGHTPSRQRPEYWLEEECVNPWFTLADVSFLRDDRNIRITSTSQRISDIGLANSAARLLPPDTVILSRTASVGFSGITDVELAVSQDFAAWICGQDLNTTYLLYCFRAMKLEFKRLMMGSTHQTIYMPDIEAFRVPVPPLVTQLLIVDFVQKATGQIDDLSAEAERVVELLKERRFALISAAVTGKIDVRNLAPAVQEAA